jgi:hypothetical protein
VEVAHGTAVTEHSAGRVAGWEQRAVRMKAGSRCQLYGRGVHYMSDMKSGKIVREGGEMSRFSTVLVEGERSHTAGAGHFFCWSACHRLE